MHPSNSAGSSRRPSWPCYWCGGTRLSLPRNYSKAFGRAARHGRVLRSLQVYISNLRRLLGKDAIRWSAPGYVLSLANVRVDAHGFERLAAQGKELLGSGELLQAEAVLKETLGLWRGQALIDFRYFEWAQPVIQRLEELRLAAIEDLMEVGLLLGRHADLISDLESVCSLNPNRDRMHRQLMLALYRAGRQTDALAVYQRLRHSLSEDLGIYASREISALQQQILNQDPTLELDAFQPDAHSRRRRGSRAHFPATTSTFVGRTHELDQIERLLSSSARVISLTGAGGIGKTRLAIAAAERWAAKTERQRVVWIDLAPLRDPRLLLSEVAAALGFSGATEPLDAVSPLLSSQHWLVVLDNVEQLLPTGATQIAALRDAGPLATLLVTSRERLQLAGEQTFPVPPLDAPDAVSLFLDRTRWLVSP